jgi:signal transduction histidine kinase/ligand-binding sensor domain-containing protein
MSVRMFILVLASLSVLLTLTASAARSTLSEDPDYLIDTWETAEGLPENSATAITQTSDGYLWFGTFNGLVRFNGVEFSVFNPANTPQLPGAEVVNLHLDQRGRLWVSTYHGLVYRDDAHSWQSLQQDGWADDYVRSFTDRRNGDLLITTFRGRLFEFSDGKLTELPSPPGQKGGGYHGCVDEDGHWWAVQNAFIGRFESGWWVPMISTADVPPDAIGCAMARDGGMWLLMSTELLKLRRGTEAIRVKLPERPGSFWSLSEDSQGNVWIATSDKGVCRVTTNGVMTRWNGANGESDRGRCIFEDRERNLWVGTSGDGLKRFTVRRFKHFDLGGGRNASLVQSVCPDTDGGMWAATFGRGLFHLSDGVVNSVAFPDQSQGGLYLKSVLVDRANRLLVGTTKSGLWLLEKDSASNITGTKTGGHNVHALYEDSRGRVWVSGGSAVAVLDAGGSQEFGPPQGLPVGLVTCFAEDAAGAIWLSNGTGVFRGGKDQRLVEVMGADDQPIHGIGCLKADTDGSMWLGSSDRGLLRWKSGRLDSLNPQARFPVRVIHGVVEDGEGFFWMTSSRSIVRAHRLDLHAAADGQTARLACQVFDQSDGLPKAEFTSGRQPVCARDARGRLWFATSKGVVMVEPGSWLPNDTPPNVQVEGISFYGPARKLRNHTLGDGRGEEILSQLHGPFATALTLPVDSRRIEVQYAALSLTAPKKVRFETKLDGEDGDWEDAGDRRAAFFYDLRPGNYVFRVRAANNDGVWNETGASLAFTVQPHLWQTLWFKALGLTALVAVVYGSLQRRVVRLEKKRAAQQALTRRLLLSQENERKRVAADLHDGLGQDLLLIKNRLVMAAARQADAGELARQLDAATAATTRAIGEVRTISHALRPAALEQVGLTKSLEWMIEQLGEGSTTKFSAELDNIDDLLAPEMEMHLFRIIQEGLSNITRHAGSTHAILEVKREADGLRVSLFDNGGGFDVKQLREETESRRGLGLAGMQERVQYLGGSLDLQSAPGHGTRVTMQVPLPHTKR